MSISVHPFSRNDLASLNLIDQQRHMQPLLAEEFYQEVLEEGFAYTVCCDGVPIAAGGVFTMMYGVGRAWALMTPETGRHMITITKITLRIMDTLAGGADYRRIETPVLKSYKEGLRWIALLGFNQETNEHGMINYGFGLEPYHLFAKYYDASGNCVKVA